MTCPHHQPLADDIREIKSDCKEIKASLGDGKVNFATMQLRIQALEKVVYGAVGMSLAALLTALLTLVFK